MTTTEPTNPPAGTETPPPEAEAAEQSRREKAAADKAARDRDLENIMLRAGLDPLSEDAPMNKLFFEGYKGEMTSEAVVAAAKGYGLIKEPSAPTGDITDPNERQQTQQRQDVQTGGPPGNEPPSEDPRVVAIKVGEAAMANGATEEMAMGAAFDHIAAAGFGSAEDNRAPDRRAQFNPGEADPRRPDLGW